MNDLFRSALRRYVLVFFDDILIYNSSWEDHLLHLMEVFDTLLANKLFVNRSKCLIGRHEVDYLGHIISTKGVSADPEKLRSMNTWPTPTTATAFPEFLGLTGYYQKFTRKYGAIAAPFTKLLKKNGFQWSNQAATAFEHLKAAMTQAPVLALSNFSKTFIVEADASRSGLGVVLMQENQPIAFYSKAISGRALA